MFSSRPRSPPSLTKNKNKKQENKSLLKDNLIANVDVDLLGGYCTSYSGYVRATKMLMMQNLVEEQENKLGAITKMQNPYIKVQQSYLDRMIKIASLFGLSPADRTRIAHLNASDKNDKPDPLLELLNGLRK